MIRNPIIHKEVVSSLRTRKALAMQVMFLLSAAALLWLLWDPQGLQDLGGREVRRILTILAMGELVMVAFFAPAFTAAALTSEKEHNTLESLLATPMKAWEITLGKIVGALSFLLLLVLSGTPALAAVFLLGGVNGMEVLAVVAVLMLTAVYLGMIGLLVSVLANRSYRAIILTYAILLVVCVLFALPCWPISDHLIRKGGPGWQGLLHVLASLSPLEAMLSVVQPGGTYGVGAENMPAFWKLFIPFSAAVTLAAAAACLLKLHRPIATPRAREKLKVVERNQISGRTIMYMWFFDPRKRRRNIGPLQNPVLIKEFRSRPMLQIRWLMRAVALCLVISVLLMFLVTISFHALVMTAGTDLYVMMATAVAALIVIVIILIGPAMTGGCLCADRETGVWDMMRTTRLSSWTIVVGKFEAAIIPLLLLAVAMVPAMLILLAFNENLWPNIIRVLQVAGMAILFVAMAGMFFSSIFSRTSTATAWTYGLVVSLSLATLLVLLGENLFSRQFARGVYMLNPVAAAMAAAGYGAMQKYDLVSGHLQIFGAATAVMFVVTVIRVVRLRRAD